MVRMKRQTMTLRTHSCGACRTSSRSTVSDTGTIGAHLLCEAVVGDGVDVLGRRSGGTQIREQCIVLHALLGAVSHGWQDVAHERRQRVHHIHAMVERKASQL